MKILSFILWTLIWIPGIAVISALADVDGKVTLAISGLTTVGLSVSLVIILRDVPESRGEYQSEERRERVTAEVVSGPSFQREELNPTSIRVQPRLSLPAPESNRALTRYER